MGVRSWILEDARLWPLHLPIVFGQPDKQREEYLKENDDKSQDTQMEAFRPFHILRTIKTIVIPAKASLNSPYFFAHVFFFSLSLSLTSPPDSFSLPATCFPAALACSLSLSIYIYISLSLSLSLSLDTFVSDSLSLHVSHVAVFCL